MELIQQLIELFYRYITPTFSDFQLRFYLKARANRVFKEMSKLGFRSSRTSFSHIGWN